MTIASVVGRLGSAALHRYVRCNERLWHRLPSGIAAAAPLRAYARRMHRLIRSGVERRQYLGTFFFRNRPQLELIRRLADQHPEGTGLTLAFVGCSAGAEAYSVLYTIRSARPDLKISAHAVDISPEILEVARAGVYPLTAPGLCGEPVFARVTADELRELCDVDPTRDQAAIKPWLREHVDWHVADAASPDCVDVLGPQDIVIASNFLCHMTPLDADACLRNVARLVRPGGHLFVCGVDLDVRTAVARELGWQPVRTLLEEIHDGDPAVRRDWPWKYWGLEPLNKAHADWELRYAAAFRLPR